MMFGMRFMHHVSARSWVLMCASVVFLASCASETNGRAPIVEVSPSPLESPASPSPEASSSPSPSPPSTEPAQPIQVSKELFNQTFNEVEALILELNAIIKRHDFDSWTSHLSADYRSQVTEPDVLTQINSSPVLLKAGVSVKTLEDYFNFVVVPSRANVHLDDLVFLSETDVEAVMIVGNRRITVYRLIKIDGQWKIGLS